MTESLLTYASTFDSNQWGNVTHSKFLEPSYIYILIWIEDIILRFITAGTLNCNMILKLTDKNVNAYRKYTYIR